jgi:diguanylate cyclase (GGDEF)-like protein
MNNKKLVTSPRTSLRYYYLMIATFVALLIIGGSIIASFYFYDVSHKNAQALQLENSVSDTIVAVRNAIWQADNALNALMHSPLQEYHQSINSNLYEAEQNLKTLEAIKPLVSTELADLINDLNEDILELKEAVKELMELRSDPNWIYPMLPYIRDTMVESHEEFMTAADLALNEIENNDRARYLTSVYRQFDQIRDLWRDKVLAFRAMILLFAGLNTQQLYSQKHNISVFHQEIQARLKELEKIKEQGLLGLESEVALESMQFHSQRWQNEFNQLLKLYNSNSWRADLDFLDEKVRPRQSHVFEDLVLLEKGLSVLSSRHISSVEHAAIQINMELWALSGLALGFVVLMYVILNRSVLTPISHIAEAIGTEGRDIEKLSLPERGSREIHTLIKAFNSMRRQLHKRQVALEHQALTDALTGLPNRALLEDRLEQAIHLAHRHDTEMALLLLDLDRFKDINDTLGHQVGDYVLQVIGQRLLDCLFESDTVARLGGDEFAIITPDTTIEQLSEFIEVISTVFERVVEVENHQLYVGASIGVAFYPHHGDDVSTLIRHADIAMYQAKRNNKSYVIYDESLNDTSIDNLSLLGDLKTELEDQSGKLQLYYQPQIDLFSHEVISVEALLRWKYPRQDFISPEQIIQMTEQTGLINDLSKWVLEKAIADCAAWQRDNMNISVAVNLSAINLQDPGLPSHIHHLLNQYNLNAGLLTLEITESAVMNDPLRAREVLQILSLMGVKLVIDDFGTGFSSLAYLKLLPVNSLKIDKSFLIDMLEEENDAIIVRSTIDLAHNLGLSVIAEGVENQKVARLLRQQKCDAAQGFYIARPMAEADLREWLRPAKSEDIL